MDCPICATALTQLEAAGVTLDVCRGGCGGIWFDNFELQKMDEPHEQVGDQVFDMEAPRAMHVDHERRRHCPKCQDLVMMRHFFSVKRQVEVDECPGCAGVWLDAGELATIRGQFETEQERKAAAERYFTDIFDEELAKMEQAQQEKAHSARRFANIFRFICPSYYIHGEQALR